MKLRTKLLLGYAGFVLALGVLGAWSARTLSEMSTVSSRIIAENYDSVVAAQDMKESLERQDSAALFELLGEHDRASGQLAEHRRRFDAAFEKAAANITEPGETEIIEAIRRGRDDYYRLYDQFLRAANGRTARYFAVLEPRFDAVRADCDRLLRLNQEAMRHKADAASAIARRWFFITLGLALVLMVIGVAVEISLSNAIVVPVRQLTAATTKIAAGDLDAAVPVHSTDEIGTLGAGFNRMAERIRELRRSDLGQLLIAQQTTEAAIDSLYDPVVVTDSDGRVTRINPAAERLFGERAETVGQPITQVARDPRIAQAVADVLRSGATVASESAAAVLPWAVDGSRRAFRVRSTPMKDTGGRLVGTVTLLEDITHLSEISRLKSEFIAAASHELRTPLTSVQMGIHLLLEGVAGVIDERQQEILLVCRDDAERLDRLMRQLLDLSKIESGSAAAPVRAASRPSTLVREAADSLRLQLEARGLRFEVDAPPDLPSVFVDRDQIDRVIVNLISNATRATPAGGTITLAAVRRGNDVAFSVTDTGAGIPRDYLPKIFEPFVQVPSTPAGGSGLGLTISRRIVEAHGGQLTVLSEPGRGSTFTFTVPISDARPPGRAGGVVNVAAVDLRINR
jgi:NtrC-family two-component system sensor histidine kinase KinB